MDKLIYLASPYSHEDYKVRKARWIAVCKITAKFIAQGHAVFSPIAHSHPVAEFSEGLVTTPFHFWEDYDRLVISRCDAVWVATLSGWDTSVGVAAEIAYARKIGKPVSFVAPEGFDVEA